MAREGEKPVLMSDQEQAFYEGLSVEIADLMTARCRASGLGPRASAAGAMAALRAVAVALWWSAPESVRGEAVLRSQMRSCCNVAVDNLMLEVRGSRSQ